MMNNQKVKKKSEKEIVYGCPNCGNPDYDVLRRDVFDTHRGSDFLCWNCCEYFDDPVDVSKVKKKSKKEKRNEV